jgi:hypothetical protein
VEGPGRHREDRATAEQRDADDRRDRDRRRDRDEAARPPLEEEELDRQQDRGERRVEGGRHAGGRPADEERLTLVGAQVDELGEDRAQRASGHDDRPLGAERAAGADRHRRCQRLQQRHPRLDPAAGGEDRLDRLGDAVAADLLRAEAGDETDHEPAADRREEDHEEGVMSFARGDQGGVDPVVEDEVGDQADQPQQTPGDPRAEHPDRQGEGGYRKQAGADVEVAEVTQVAGAGGHCRENIATRCFLDSWNGFASRSPRGSWPPVWMRRPDRPGPRVARARSTPGTVVGVAEARALLLSSLLARLPAPADLFPRCPDLISRSPSAYRFLRRLPSLLGPSVFFFRFSLFLSVLLLLFSLAQLSSLLLNLHPPSTPAPLASGICQHQPPTPIALISDDGRAGSAAQGRRFWLWQAVRG